ncbi:hypothetical protein [Stieleria mannarensis]|uniref:hypothetical protein n=1 Tax=Stieleria mannarensis TaxID=2755585 RepID=UPI0015FFE57F|nr:hypothetical protein [Rhodopirellula sp. JC639]
MKRFAFPLITSTLVLLSLAPRLSWSQGNAIDENRRLQKTYRAKTRELDFLLDSALFAYVSSSGTDPEVFLLIEARDVDGQSPWTYSIARFTTREIWMSRGDQPMVRIDETPSVSRTTGRIVEPYFYRVESVLSVDDLEPDE